MNRDFLWSFSGSFRHFRFVLRKRKIFVRTGTQQRVEQSRDFVEENVGVDRRVSLSDKFVHSFLAVLFCSSRENENFFDRTEQNGFGFYRSEQTRPMFSFFLPSFNQFVPLGFDLVENRVVEIANVFKKFDEFSPLRYSVRRRSVFSRSMKELSVVDRRFRFVDFERRWFFDENQRNLRVFAALRAQQNFVGSSRRRSTFFLNGLTIRENVERTSEKIKSVERKLSFAFVDRRNFHRFDFDRQNFRRRRTNSAEFGFLRRSIDRFDFSEKQRRKTVEIFLTRGKSRRSRKLFLFTSFDLIFVVKSRQIRLLLIDVHRHRCLLRRQRFAESIVDQIELRHWFLSSRSKQIHFQQIFISFRNELRFPVTKLFVSRRFYEKIPRKMATKLPEAKIRTIFTREKKENSFRRTGAAFSRGISMEKSRSSKIRSSGRRFSSRSILHWFFVKTFSFFLVNFDFGVVSNSKNLKDFHF